MRPSYARPTVLIFVLGQVLTTAAQQASPPAAAATPAATVRGRVLTDAGAPLAGAHIVISSPALREGRHTLSTSEGRYELTGVPPGTHTLSVSKAGFVTLKYGQRSPTDPQRSVTVSGSETVTGIDVALSRSGVIVVQVVDELGEPIAGINARAEQRRFSDGERRLVPIGDVQMTLNETDDLGEVRIAGLAPGDYYVSAQTFVLGVARGPRTYARTYFPATASPEEAQAIALRAGQEARVTIPLAAQRFAQISGVFRRPDGSALKPSRILLSGPGTSVFLPNSSGNFSFDGVPPGNYVLEVGPDIRGEPSGDVASVPITVTGDDMTDLVAMTRTGPRMRGRIVFDAPLPEGMPPSAVQLTALRRAGDVIQPRFTIRDDWTFEGLGFLGTRTIRARTPAGWFLKSIMVDGRDIVDTAVNFDTVSDMAGVEVLLTRTQSAVAGAVVDARNRPVTSAVVVVFPEERAQWTSASRFFGTAVPDGQGAFTVGGLPAGRYMAIALDRLQAGEERDPDLLDRILPRAESMTLGEGETRPVTLRVREY